MLNEEVEPSVWSRIVVNSVTTRVAGRFLSSEPNLAWLLQNYCALQVLLLRLARSGLRDSQRDFTSPLSVMDLSGIFPNWP
jgi:hypothetical protein